jgi:hypothetical protein
MSSVFFCHCNFQCYYFSSAYFAINYNKICYSLTIKLYFTLFILLHLFSCFYYFIYVLAFYLFSCFSILFVFLLFIYFLLWSQLIISGWSTTSGNKKEFPVWNLRLRLQQENGINFTFSFSDFWFLFSVNVQICMRTYIEFLFLIIQT